MQAMVESPRKVWSEAELQALPDGGSLLPGFRYPVADLFKEWDWD